MIDNHRTFLDSNARSFTIIGVVHKGRVPNDDGRVDIPKEDPFYVVLEAHGIDSESGLRDSSAKIAAIITVAILIT